MRINKIIEHKRKFFHYDNHSDDSPGNHLPSGRFPIIGHYQHSAEDSSRPSCLDHAFAKNVGPDNP